MCGSTAGSGVPQTSVSFVISYVPEGQRWSGTHCSHTITVDGDIVMHGSSRRDFGPFDGVTEVLAWAYGEARSLIRQMPIRDSVRQQVPPQGNEDGPTLR